MIKAYFLNSTLAKYDDSDFAWIQSTLLEKGVLANPAGVLGLAVTQNGTPNMGVQVAIGKSLVEIVKGGKTFKVIIDSDAISSCAITSNSTGANRIDAIVVRVNVTAEPNILKSNIGTIETVLGTGVSALSDGAITTALGSDGWIRLANITVANGASSILNASIADTRVQVATNNAIKVKDNFIDTSSFAIAKFGGTGADGALTVVAGVTTIDLAGAALFVKNYSSISITGTGSIAFINPHANGTIIMLKSKSNITITTSTVPAIDASGMGAQGSSDGNTSVIANPKTGTDGIGGTGGNYGAGGIGGTRLGVSATIVKDVLLSCGAGGGKGADNFTGFGTMSGGGGGGGSSAINNGSTGTGGNFASSPNGGGSTGGRGGGALYIECGGAYNCTSTLWAKGANSASTAGGGGASGGGGGGGSIVVRYNTLTTDTGTYTVTGGTGGTTGQNSGGGVGGTGGTGYTSIAKNTELV